MSQPKMTVVIPWCNRPEIVDTLDANLPIFEKNNAEVIISNAGGDSSMIQRVVNSNITICEVPVKEFNRSLAVNIGVAVAASENLFILDADIFIIEDFLQEALEMIQSKPAVVAIDRVLESAMMPRDGHDAGMLLEDIRMMHEVRTKDGRTAIVQTHREPLTYYSRTGNGEVIVKKSDFIEVDGMNTRLEGWGFEDTDLLIRLQLGLGLQYETMGVAKHLSHDNVARNVQGQFQGTMLERERFNFKLCLQLYQQGIFTGTYKSVVNRWMNDIRIIKHIPIHS